MTILAQIEGTLPVGLRFAGGLHIAFKLRRSTVGDAIAAFEEVGEDSALKLEAAQIARQLAALGEVPAKDITTALVIGLDELDFETLAAARGLLAKKPSSWPGSSIPDWPKEPASLPRPAPSVAPSSG